MRTPSRLVQNRICCEMRDMEIRALPGWIVSRTAFQGEAEQLPDEDILAHDAGCAILAHHGLAPTMRLFRAALGAQFELGFNMAAQPASTGHQQIARLAPLALIARQRLCEIAHG